MSSGKRTLKVIAVSRYDVFFNFVFILIELHKLMISETINDRNFNSKNT